MKINPVAMPQETSTIDSSIKNDLKYFKISVELVFIYDYHIPEWFKTTKHKYQIPAKSALVSSIILNKEEEKIKTVLR